MIVIFVKVLVTGFFSFIYKFYGTAYKKIKVSSLLALNGLAVTLW